MCEASAAPLHDEGLLGDAVTFLLTANFALQVRLCYSTLLLTVLQESDNRFKSYLAAQAGGQVSNTVAISAFTLLYCS